MSQKVLEITSWKQLKDQITIGSVILEYPDGNKVMLPIQGLTQAKIDSINDHYDSLKKPQPYKEIKVDGKKGKREKIYFQEGTEEYEVWKRENDAIDSARMAHLAVEFLSEEIRPDGDTIEDKILELKNVLLAGHFFKIVEAGYKISGYDIDSKVEEAKNS